MKNWKCGRTTDGWAGKKTTGHLKKAETIAGADDYLYSTPAIFLSTPQ